MANHRAGISQHVINTTKELNLEPSLISICESTASSFDHTNINAQIYNNLLNSKFILFLPLLYFMNRKFSKLICFIFFYLIFHF